ncbi:MAG TPA: dihydrofolate reductase family protein [Woeseiaceae bacterium]|nr:dihydrofolate reductase family protein [Woeseiaceae bacterium]
MTDLLRLFPTPGGPVALQGLYLDRPLEPPGFTGPLFVYSDFVVSLDGRIAAAPPGERRQRVPAATANPRDWRLYQELAGHADVLITSGRYLRDLAAGRAQDVLPVSSDPGFADVRRWRQERALAPQPDVAVVSGSLDFPVPPSLFGQGRRVMAFTAASAPAERVQAREREGARVLKVGEENVDGGLLCERLADAGYRRAYSVTGARVLHTLLAAGRLDALFLTTVHRLIAGEPFTSLLQGETLPSPAGFRLSSLYYDAATRDGVGQTFARYDCVRESPATVNA